MNHRTSPLPLPPPPLAGDVRLAGNARPAGDVRLAGEGAGGRGRAILFLLLVLLALPAWAQTPRISALYPAGAKAGDTVEVAVRGGNLVGVKRVLVIGQTGVTAELVGGGAAVDEAAKPVFQQKCQLCHELRSPANRTMTPEQWAATVDRMISQRSAPIAKEERDRIVPYLQALSRAGQVTARIRVAPDAAPGLRELRLGTDQGASTAWPFEIGALPETMAVEPNSEPGQPQRVTLPLVVNGALAQGGERDYFAFEAKKGQRLAFNLKGFRLNEQSQTFFNPALYLYDATGKVIAKNFGHFDFDPLIDWTAPEDGTYTLLVRDLLWRGTPASVYRLTMGPLAAEAASSTDTEGGGPSFTLETMPDSVSIGPGGMAALVVRATNRRGLRGPITLALRNLPEGISAAPTVIPPDDDKAVVVLSASPGTAAEVRVAAVEGQAAGESGQSIVRQARPLEIYLYQNQRRTQPRSSLVVALAAAPPDFTLTVDKDTFSLSQGGSVRLPVKVHRREGFKGNVVLSVPSLPPGIEAQNAVNVPPGQTEATITLRATAAARFLQERPLPDLPPMRIVVSGTGGDNTVASAPVALVGEAAKETAQK